MIIFLYGKDTYRLQQKLKEIETQYRKIHKSGLDLEKFDALQIEFREFWDKLFQRSMFSRKKLFFLENLFSNPEFKKEFLKKIEQVAKSEDVVVVLEKQELPKKDKLFLGLKKQAKSQEFLPLTGQKLRQRIEREINKQGMGIERGALEKLIDFVGDDSWRLANELQKLIHFKKDAKIIKEEDIELLVRPKVETDIFKTIAAVAQKEKGRALSLLQKHLQKGDSPIYLLSMISFQFRNLLIASALRERGKTLDDFLRLKICHPYAARKSWQTSAGFNLSQLKKIYQRIFEADLNIKIGKAAPEEGLKTLIAQI